MASIDALLDEMEDILDEGRGTIFSSKMTVDVEALKTVIEDLRLNVPEEVKQAKILASERREIMDRANHEYESTVENAKVISHDLLAAAEKRAKDLDAETNRRTEELMQATQQKAQSILQAARAEADRLVSQQNVVAEANLKAQEIKIQADGIIGEAQAQAQNCLDEAKARAQRIVDDTQYNCDRNLAAAEKWAHDLKLSASKYVDEIVTEAEYRIGRSYGEIKKLQENLDAAEGKTVKEKQEMDKQKPANSYVASGDNGMTEKHQRNMEENARGAYGRRQNKRSSIVEDDNEVEVIRHQSVIDIPLDDDIFSNSFDDPPLHEKSNYNIQL